MITSAEKANQLIENIQTAVLVFDHDLQLTHINSAAENLLSVSQRKVIGVNAYVLLPGLPEFVLNIQRALTSGHSFTEWGIELSQNGSGAMTLDSVVTPVMEQNKCQEVVVELIDARSSTRVKREESISVLHEAARKSLQGMAHEVKNPLGGIRGAAQLLARELNGSSELNEYTQIIINETDRLCNLIDRMLTSNERQELTNLNVHEVLDYVQSIVEAESNNRLRIKRDFDPSLPSLLADREQLIQAFVNVFKNAIQAINEGGEILLRTRVKRRCTIRQHHYRLALKIEIIDDGPGIPAEIEGEVFYPLVTGRAEGTGLGLSIAHSLIQQNRGMIEYERTDGLTIFRILLPLDEDDA